MTDDRLHHDFGPPEPEQSRGHPLIATLICLFVLIMGVGGSLGMAHEPARNLAELLGEIAGHEIFAAMLWGIAYAITIKRSSSVWQIGSLIGLVLFGLLTGLVAIGARNVARETDARDIAHQLRQVLDSDKLPDHVGAGSGPLSQMSAAVLNREFDAQRELERDLEAAGFTQVVSFDGLARTSPVLRNCGAFGPIAAHARSLEAEGWRANLAAARQIGDAAVQEGRLSASEEADFFAGAEQSQGAYGRQWGLNAEIVEEGQAVCTLLASRPWVRSGGRVLFTQPGDAAVVNGHLRKIWADGAEQDRMRQDVRARSRSQMNNLDFGHG